MALKREPLASQGRSPHCYHNDLIFYGPAALVIGDADSWAADGARTVRAYSRTSYLTLEKLAENNEVAGFKFAVVGVLYAVLLAFAIIVVWERFSDAENNVAREAGAAATIYRLSQGINGQPGIALRGALTNYVRAVISEGWPAMERGSASISAGEALDSVYKALLTFESPERRDTALVSEILHQLDTITEMRRARLSAAEGLVPGLIWTILFGGAVITIAYTFFFGIKNLGAQTLMTGMLSIIILSGLLTAIVIDQPFAGVVKVKPRPLTDVLEDFGSMPGDH
jgi:Na+/melibiose symporter-like transporter